MPQTDILYKSLIDIGLSLPDARIRSIQRYVETLEKWNRTMNLTALKGSALVRRLVVEPLWVAAELSPSGRYLDIGSGNGSPAIPWHILQEFVAVDLVESRRRRATFLQRAIREIGLTGVRVHPIRFEDAVSGLEPMDWITLQGVRLTPKLLEQMRALGGEATQVVWFTKAREPSASPSRILEIPHSDRQALVFLLRTRTSPGSL